MSEPFFMAVDAGTGSVRAVLTENRSDASSGNGSTGKIPAIRAVWTLTGYLTGNWPAAVSAAS